MEATQGTPARPERLLLEHLAAFERLTGEPGPSARARLVAELGADRAEFLLRALGPRPRCSDEPLAPAATA